MRSSKLVMAMAAAASLEHPKFPLGKRPSIGPYPPLNPFHNPHSFSTLHLLISLLMLPAFLCRSLLLLLSLAFGHVWVKLALLGVKDPLYKPFPPWRRSLLWPLRLGARFVLFLFGYYWIPVKGKCAPRDIAPIIVSNHISFLDPLFLLYAHLPVIISAKENLKLPFVGVLIQALQVIAVDRSSPTSRHNATAQIRRRAIDNLWPHIAIFPEGTTTNGKSLISFKAGAFSPGLPVQPMVIKYSNVNPAWVDEGPLSILFRLMTEPINFMQVEYLAVAVPTRNELQDPHSYAERVRRTMAEALNVPWTDHTFLDAKLAVTAAKLHQPKDLSLVEFGRMEKLFHMDFETVKKYLEKFSTMDTTHSGLLRIEQFLDALGLPLTPYTQEVFHLFDKSDKGIINFREFAAGLAFLSNHTSFATTIKTAFHSFDTDGDGYLSKSEIERSIRAIFPNLSNSQMTKIFHSLGLDDASMINWDDFSTFLQQNPEYLALIMTAHPEFLSENEEYQGT